MYTKVTTSINVCTQDLKRKSKETWMANELATILHKLDRDTEERADERERKQLLN